MFRLARPLSVTLAMLGGASAALASGTAAEGAPVKATFVAASGWAVSLLPPLNTGQAGWCIGEGFANADAFDCGAAISEGRPIVAESWSGGGPPPRTDGFVVTLARVRSVSVEGGPVIPTRPEPNLPLELRAAAVEADASLRSLIGPQLRFTPFDAQGDQLERVSDRNERERELPSAFWMRPSRPRKGVCAIAVRGVPRLVERQGTVVTHLAPTPGIVDRGLLQCASTYYEEGTWPLRVSLLLDALEPGRAKPVAIPGMKPIRGHPGDFGEIARPFLKLLARRWGNAWVLVEGGAGLNDRLAAMSHLRLVLSPS